MKIGGSRIKEAGSDGGCKNENVLDPLLWTQLSDNSSEK
jgi:hypothetical protein